MKKYWLFLLTGLSLSGCGNFKWFPDDATKSPIITTKEIDAGTYIRSFRNISTNQWFVECTLATFKTMTSARSPVGSRATDQYTYKDNILMNELLLLNPPPPLQQEVFVLYWNPAQ